MDIGSISVPAPRYFFRKRLKSFINGYVEDRQIRRIRQVMVSKICSGMIEETVGEEEVIENAFLMRHMLSISQNDLKLKNDII